LNLSHYFTVVLVSHLLFPLILIHVPYDWARGISSHKTLWTFPIIHIHTTGKVLSIYESKSTITSTLYAILYRPTMHTSFYCFLAGTFQCWLLHHAYNRGRTVSEQSKVIAMNYNDRNYTVTHKESLEQNSERGSETDRK